MRAPHQSVDVGAPRAALFALLAVAAAGLAHTLVSGLDDHVPGARRVPTVDPPPAPPVILSVPPSLPVPTAPSRTDGSDWGVVATLINPGTPNGRCGRTGMTYQLQQFDWGLMEWGIFEPMKPVKVDLICEPPPCQHIWHPFDDAPAKGDRHAFNLHFELDASGQHLVRLTTRAVVELPPASTGVH